MLALSACIRRRNERWGTVIIFAIGSLAGYLSLAAGWEMLARMLTLGSWLYAIVAAFLIVSGLRELLRQDHGCKNTTDVAAGISPVGVAIVGFSFAWMFSPCCSPLILSFALRPEFGTRLFAVGWYAVGHLVPTFALACGGATFVGKILTPPLREALRTVMAVCGIGIGLLYAAEI